MSSLNLYSNNSNRKGLSYQASGLTGILGPRPVPLIIQRHPHKPDVITDVTAQSQYTLTREGIWSNEGSSAGKSSGESNQSQKISVKLSMSPDTAGLTLPRLAPGMETWILPCDGVSFPSRLCSAGSWNKTFASSLTDKLAEAARSPEFKTGAEGEKGEVSDKTVIGSYHVRDCLILSTQEAPTTDDVEQYFASERDSQTQEEGRSETLESILGAVDVVLAFSLRKTDEGKDEQQDSQREEA